ncbi:MAG: DMT family transporter [Deltaproteobacteria bacterium]|nr:DMT family transporter [Deltaproteobacteria bacterium]
MGLDCWVVNALRYSVAPVFWLPFIIARRRRNRPDSGGFGAFSDLSVRSPIWVAAIVPAAINLVTQVVWGLVGKYAEAGMIGFAAKLAFPFTVVYSFLLFPDERRLAKMSAFWIGGSGSLIGLALLSAEKIGGYGGGGTTAFGYSLLLFMAVSWGGYPVTVKKYMSGYSSVLSFWVVSVYTTMFLMFLMFLFGDFSTFHVMDLRAWAILIGSSLIGIAFWHVLYYRSLKDVGAVVSDGVLMASPFLTIAGSAVLLGERLTALQFVGGVAVVGAGILLVVAHGRVTNHRTIPDVAEGR